MVQRSRQNSNRTPNGAEADSETSMCCCSEQCGSDQADDISGGLLRSSSTQTESMMSANESMMSATACGSALLALRVGSVLIGVNPIETHFN